MRTIWAVYGSGIGFPSRAHPRSPMRVQLMLHGAAKFSRRTTFGFF